MRSVVPQKKQRENNRSRNSPLARQSPACRGPRAHADVRKTLEIGTFPDQTGTKVELLTYPCTRLLPDLAFGFHTNDVLVPPGRKVASAAGAFWPPAWCRQMGSARRPPRHQTAAARPSRDAAADPQREKQCRGQVCGEVHAHVPPCSGHS